MTSSVHTKHDWSTTKPSIAVIDAIATLENVDPVDLSTILETTLFDHINPDALNSLVTKESTISISFSIDEYLIRIDDKGLVIGCE